MTPPPPRGHLAALIDALDDESDTDRAGDQLDALKRFLRELGVAIAASDRVTALRLIDRACRQVDDRLREVDARDRDCYLAPSECRDEARADEAHARARDESLAAT